MTLTIENKAAFELQDGQVAAVRMDHDKPCALVWPQGVRIEWGAYSYGPVPRLLHWGGEALVRIGRYCSIASGLTLFLGGNHRMDGLSTHPLLGGKAPESKSRILIGHDVWIGDSVTLMNGVVVDHHAVIGAHSVVRGEVGMGSIVLGNPAIAARRDRWQSSACGCFVFMSPEEVRVRQDELRSNSHFHCGRAPASLMLFQAREEFAR